VGIRVPMSVSDLRNSETKRGKGCKVCDVIINDQVASQIKEDPQMQNFFLQLCNFYFFLIVIVQSYLYQKFEVECQDMYFMQKMKYFGPKIQTQRIKVKKAPKIEIVEEPENASNPKKTQENPTDDKPQYVEFKVISEAGIKAQKKKGIFKK
jgi:hypothetical protein